MSSALSPSVKWLYTTDINQQRPALCIVHEDNALCVQAGEVVRVIVRTAKEFIGMRPVMHDGELYTVKKAVAKLREVEQRIGITTLAGIVLDAIESDDPAVLEDAIFIDEEGKTMRDDPQEDSTDGGEETGAVTAVVKKKLPPPRKSPSPVSSGGFVRNPKTTAAPAAAVKKTETKSTTPIKGTKEKTVAAKKNVKSKKKVVAKKAAAAAGEGGFRAGSNMEKGFIAYKAARKEYQGFERGDKQAWAQKLADKLGTTLNSVRTMISKNWEPLLAK